MRWSWMLVWVVLVCVGSQVCSEGEYLDGGKVCQQCDISCATCYSSDGCTTCYEQMFMVSRGNMVVCDICYNINKGCTTCQTAAKCIRCSNGYFLLTDNTCASCASLTPHCLLCTPDGTVCLSCENPYQIVAGTCWKNSTAVDTNTGGQVTLSATATGANATGGSGNNEKKEENVVKSKCESNYVEVSGICFIVIPYCMSYSQSGSCLVCVDSYTLNQGYCLPAILMATIAAAQSSSLPQSSAAAQNAINSGSSQSTPNCGPNQYISNGQCVNVGRECLSFTNAGKCLVCDVGFSVYNGLCIQSAPAAASNPQSPSNPQNNAQNDHSQSGGGSVALTVDPACVPPCALCQNSNPMFCFSCVSGFATVDEIPGQCFNF